MGREVSEGENVVEGNEVQERIDRSTHVEVQQVPASLTLSSHCEHSTFYLPTDTLSRRSIR